MFRFLIYCSLLYLLLETSFKKYSNSTDLSLPNYNHNCHYAQLHCGCYSKYGGCGVKCSPSYSYTLYNQTSCPPVEDHFLSGFT